MFRFYFLFFLGGVEEGIGEGGLFALPAFFHVSFTLLTHISFFCHFFISRFPCNEHRGYRDNYLCFEHFSFLRCMFPQQFLILISFQQLVWFSLKDFSVRVPALPRRCFLNFGFMGILFSEYCDGLAFIHLPRYMNTICHICV